MFSLLLFMAGLSIYEGKILQIKTTDRFPPNVTDGFTTSNGEDSMFNVIDGEDADIELFPFYAMIVKRNSAERTVQTGQRLKLICGSSLIHPKFILTAFHCFKKNPRAEKWVAVFHLLDRCHPTGYKMVDIKEIYFHPGSETSQRAKINDLALAELIEPVYDIPPVNLPRYPPITGRAGVLIGFGRMKLLKIKTDNEVPCILQKTSESIEDPAKCRHTHSQVIGSFCAKSIWRPTSTACRGDSGGPWLAVGGDGYELQGLSSFGSLDCNPAQGNDFFTSVYQFKPWIFGVVDSATRSPPPQYLY